MNPLVQVYESLLQYAGMTADEKGYVSDSIDNDPVHINGNRLVLPTNFQLRENVNDPERIIFHPFSENVIRGEPLTVKKLRTNINIRLNQAIAIIGPSLLQLVASPALHRKLSPEQFQLLKVVLDVDEKCAVNLSSAGVAAMKEGVDRAFLNIFLCRGGTKDNKKYSRLGVVSFPCYAKIHQGEFGKLRVRDKDTILQLFNFMFPNSETTDAYSEGSDSTVAPFLQALLNATGPLATRINELIDLYEEFIPFDDKLTKENLYFNMDWLDVVTNLEDHAMMIRSVPAQNDGPIGNNQPEATATNQASATATPIHRQAQATASAPAAPTIQKNKDGIDFNSLMSTVAPQTAAPGGMVTMTIPAGMAAAMMNGGGMPGGWPNQQQPQQQHVPGWAQVPPQQQMVDTPQGHMNLAVAMQLGLPYRPIQQTQMGQSYPTNHNYGNGGGVNMNPPPNWAR